MNLRGSALALLGALGMAACNGGGNGDDESPAVAGGTETTTYDFYVDSTFGSDANAGSAAAPFKTISRALAFATTGQTVKVAPGTYGAATGEIFPIALPAGASLIGDEANKGGGQSPTRILGGGKNADGYGTVIDAGANSVIAGFTLTDTNSSLTFAMELAVRNSGVTIRNNRVVNGTDTGIYVYKNSTNHVITGNIIQNIKNGYSGLGLGFVNGGNGSLVENNVISGNEIGVEYDNVPGGDLGGGSAGSVGGNRIYNNTRADLWTVTSGITVFAKNNFWNHAPPTVQTAASGDTVTAGNDVYNYNGGATIITTGAKVVLILVPINPVVTVP